VPRELVRNNRYKFFIVGALGTFMATLDHSIVNVALPSIAADLSCSVDLVAWVVLAYSLTLISLLMVFGAWTERRGYLFAYKFGYVFFLAGSLFCALSPNIYLLIIGRVVQGIGSAMFAAIGPSMVTTVFPREDRGRGLGMMMMMVSGGLMVGPPLGGLLLGIWSWPAIFFVNLPVGAFGLTMVYRYFPLLEKKQEGRKIPLFGAACISLALVAAIFTLKMITVLSLSDPTLWVLVILSLTALTVFLKIESDSKKALIGLGILRNRQFTTSLGAQLMYFAGLSGTLVLVPFYLERVKGFVPQQVGCILMILPVLMFLVAPLAGRLSDKIGFRLLTTLGMLGITCGFYLLSGLNTDTSTMYLVLALVMVGLGAGTFGSPNSSALMGSVTENQRAVTSGIQATNRNMGQALGVAIATTLFAFFEARHSYLGDDRLVFIASFRPVVYVAIGLALVGATFCLARANRSV